MVPLRSLGPAFTHSVMVRLRWRMWSAGTCCRTAAASMVPASGVALCLGLLRMTAWLVRLLRWISSAHCWCFGGWMCRKLKFVLDTAEMVQLHCSAAGRLGVTPEALG